MITDYKHVTIFPMAIPSIASPGAIMAVVLMTDNHIYTIQEQALTTVLVMFVIGLTCLLLLGANAVQKRIGDYGITVISKVMGLNISFLCNPKHSDRIEGFLLFLDLCFLL